VPKAIKPVLLIWLVACSVLCQGLFAQIAPLRDDLPSPPAAGQERTPAVPGEPQPAVKVLIRGWSLDSEIGSADMRHGDLVQMEPGYPGITVFFDAQPSSIPIEFRYRLDDLDSDWTETTSRLAHYRRLPPGHYRFEVQARTAGQPWPAAMAVLAIHQRPFFYQTWYFYLLVILGLVAMAAQLLSQRDQLLKGQMGIVLEERNRIASDCHDTLMAGFAAISWQLEATAKLFRDAGDSASPAARSCELARSMVAHCQAEARRIIWDLRDAEELTNILSEALSRAINAHTLRESVETSFEVQGQEIPIAPGAVHHLVCIGQEAMTNAVRHADASNIHIALRYGSEALSLSIRDNGHGFQTSAVSTRTGHFGIPVMEERARKLGGTLRLTSSADAGTEVAVTVGFQSVNLPDEQQHNIVPWIGV
jgi:signal transduction histidine kinase